VIHNTLVLLDSQTIDRLTDEFYALYQGVMIDRNGVLTIEQANKKANEKV
jgi:hypothetical protein